MMMPLKSERYIDAERLKGVVNVRSSHWLCGWDTLGVLAVIDEQPTADVAPVRHGHWIVRWEGTYPKRAMYCSHCNKKSGIGGIEKNQKKTYCPNCGAKMDEETNNGKE